MPRSPPVGAENSVSPQSRLFGGRTVRVGHPAPDSPSPFRFVSFPTISWIVTTASTGRLSPGFPQGGRVRCERDRGSSAFGAGAIQRSAAEPRDQFGPLTVAQAADRLGGGDPAAGLARDRPGRDRSEVRPAATHAPSPSARSSAGRRAPVQARSGRRRPLASVAHVRDEPRSPSRARATAARATRPGAGVRLTTGTVPILRVPELEARENPEATASTCRFGTCWRAPARRSFPFRIRTSMVDARARIPDRARLRNRVLGKVR
jgi:hypothetical protein